MHKNQAGQSLVEYLIIVSLVAVGSIAIMRSMGQTVQGQFANITQALQGRESNAKLQEVRETDFQKRTLQNFFGGSSDH